MVKQAICLVKQANIWMACTWCNNKCNKMRKQIKILQKCIKSKKAEKAGF